MQNGEKSLPSIILAGRGLEVKMLKLLNHMVYLDQILLYSAQTFNTYLFKYCPAASMQNGDTGLPSIILAGQVFKTILNPFSCLFAWFL